ncbi:hypothetical protein ACFX5Q_25810 [Mesorhizobium sp. IMUNJ 23033]|uniref:hypothetical protein n=1 Tax=Mesorhizobium sp. IMUNJ 23033 TaxID=3378039 RepID=UPI0038509C75
MTHRFTLLLGFLVALLMAQVARAEGPVSMVDDPAILAALDARGFGFAGVFAVDGEDDLKALYDEAPAYHAIVDTVAGDVAALRAEMKAGGRTLYEVTDGNVGRIMDMRWLKTAAARFRLVGVINRIDRRDFADVQGESSCGEVRFIYRLAYSFKKNGKVLASRLPFNFNAVYSAAPDADGGCVGVAGRWTSQLDESVDAGWLVGGPLEKAGLSFKQLELNAQVVRFPSGQETEFGGQAAYLMRIFDFDGAAISEKPLENTPDAARLTEDAALKKRLADYISANVAVVDLGVYEIPDEFLAKKVISWSTSAAPGRPTTRLRHCSSQRISAGSIIPGSSWCARRRPWSSGWTMAPARAAIRQARPLASISSVSTTERRRRSIASRSASRRISMPKYRAARPGCAPRQTARSRTGSGRCPSRRRPPGRIQAMSTTHRPRWRCRAWCRRMPPASAPSGSAAAAPSARRWPPLQACAPSWRNACCPRTARTCFPAIHA